MQYEFSTVNDQILCLNVLETPHPENARVLNEAMLQELTQRGWSRLLVDYRHMNKSEFDAGIARAILLQMDRLLDARSGGAVQPNHLSIALVSTEGSFGHGIARMTMGHAYGLRHLDLRHFTDWPEAQDWLCGWDAATPRSLAGNGPE